MILADKIINERKRMGLSQEEMAEHLSVSRQAVSKWESAQATPDLQRILLMAQLFGVSTDYLLKDEMEPEDPRNFVSVSKEESVPVVSMEEANAFMEARSKSGPAVALGVALCILCPVVLMLLCGTAESGKVAITEGIASAIGLTVLFAMIGTAVWIFITVGSKTEKFEWMEQEHFETAYGVSGLVKERKKAYADTYTRGIAAGVVLCVIAAVPLIAYSCLENSRESVIMVLAALLLCLVALGVFLIIRVSMIKDGYDILLEEGDHKAEDKLDKESRRKLQLISGIYWGAVTAVYLAWSFLSKAWDRTWVVWPVAGVLFAVVISISKLCLKKKV